ncbi:MAG: ABC transporter substrate-binding protein [Victivallaceae bacterium]|nr:ABC transporter substrate-binding protein [Victivallaceae bacterium]
MNGNSGIKAMLAVLIIAVAAATWFNISALDRVRAGNRLVAEKLDALAASLQQRELSPVASEQPRQDSDIAAEHPANWRFFDHRAPVNGELVQTLQADAPGLNTIIAQEATAAMFFGLCSSSPAERDYEHPEKFEPMMAESWKISPDHKFYRIRLRRGMMWQSFIDPDTGKQVPPREVTAHDFKFFIDVVKTPEVNCEALRGYYEAIDEVKVIDNYEFTVSWKREYYGSLASTLGMTPLPRHFYWSYPGPFDGKRFNDDHKRNRMLVSCGPYKLSSWQRGKRIEFVRNELYFGNALGVGASLRKLVFEVIALPNTRFQALLAGKVGMLGLTPDQWVRRNKLSEFASGRLAGYRYLLPQYTYIGYNEKNPLFSDRRVRQALTMLTDREKIKRDIYLDEAEIVSGPFMPGGVYDAPEIKPWPYDPVRAKALLAEAGWRDGDGDGILEKDGKKFSFTMLQIASSAIQSRMMPLLKESFAAAGVEMKIANVEWSVYLQKIDRREYDSCCLGWSSSFDPDLYQIFHSSQADAPGGSNHISYKSEAVDRLIVEMRRTFDMKKRIELARKLAAILHEDQPYTFLFAPYSLVAVSDLYRNVRVFPAGIPDILFWTTQKNN